MVAATAVATAAAAVAAVGPTDADVGEKFALRHEAEVEQIDQT